MFALDNSFRPDTIEVNVGDEVLWENRGQNEHDILSVEGASGQQAELPGEVDWKTAELPELSPHENMPDPANAPAAPATDVPRPVDVAAIEVPELP